MRDRRDYVDFLKVNAREEAEQRQAVAQAERDVADVIEEQNDRVRQSREDAAEAARAVVEQEREIQDERAELAERVEDLIDAEKELRGIRAGEGDRRLASKNDISRTELELRQKNQELAEALFMGDADRAAELRLDISDLGIQLRDGSTTRHRRSIPLIGSERPNLLRG